MDTKKLLEHISNNCSSELSKYKYNKGLDISDKYRKGKVTSYQYVLDLIYHFFEKERLLKKLNHTSKCYNNLRQKPNIKRDSTYV